MQGSQEEFFAQEEADCQAAKESEPMTKKIAYTITDSGVDGRGATIIRSAFWDEKARDEALEDDKNKNWRSKAEQIVNVEVAVTKARNKLDGLERLVLGIR